MTNKMDYQAMTQKELEDLIRIKVSSDPKWAYRALLTLYARQTADEQADPAGVHHKNGMGFSPTDSEFLSSLAHQVKMRGSLSPKQLEWAFKLLPKYARQLAKIAKEKAQTDAIAHTAYPKENPEDVPLYSIQQFMVDHTEGVLVTTTGNLGLPLDGDKLPEKFAVGIEHTKNSLFTQYFTLDH